jgi:hypothetical protein
LSEPQWFTGGVFQVDPEISPDIFGLLFISGDQLYFANNIDQLEDSLYALSSDIELIMNYDTPGNFTSIKLTALNDQNKASQDLDVEFHQPTPIDDGIKWYIIVLIVCGCLLIVLVGFGIVQRYVKNRRAMQKKESLMESENN